MRDILKRAFWGLAPLAFVAAIWIAAPSSERHIHTALQQSAKVVSTDIVPSHAELLDEIRDRIAVNDMDAKQRHSATVAELERMRVEIETQRSSLTADISELRAALEEIRKQRWDTAKQGRTRPARAPEGDWTATIERAASGQKIGRSMETLK